MSSRPIEPFDQSEYQSRKKREKWLAWIFMILGGIVLINSSSPVPIPMMGISSILLGGALLAYGYYQFKIFHKLPLHDALQYAHFLDKNFTKTDLFLTFKLSPEKIDELVQELIQNGFIEPVDSELPPESDIQYRVIH